MCDSLLDRDPNDVTAIFFKGGAIGFEGTPEIPPGRLPGGRERRAEGAAAGPGPMPSWIPTTATSSSAPACTITMRKSIPDGISVRSSRSLLFVPPGDKPERARTRSPTAAEKGKYASVEADVFSHADLLLLREGLRQGARAVPGISSRGSRTTCSFTAICGRCLVAVTNWNGGARRLRRSSQRVTDGQRGYTTNVEREAAYYCGCAA